MVSCCVSTFECPIETLILHLPNTKNAIYYTPNTKNRQFCPLFSPQHHGGAMDEASSAALHHDDPPYRYSD